MRARRDLSASGTEFTKSWESDGAAGQIHIWRVGERAYLASFILSDLVLGMLFAVFALAIGAPCFRNVDLLRTRDQPGVWRIR